MRNIGTLKEQDQARRFGDFLSSQGIRNLIEQEQEGWLIWVEDDDQLAEAGKWLAEFQRDPAAARFKGAAGATERARRAEEKANTEFRRRYHDRRRLFPMMGSYGAGLFTLLLMAVCLYVAVQSKLGQDRDFVRQLLIADPGIRGREFLAEVRAGQWWRLLTPTVVHFGPVHLLFNIMSLYYFGSLIEARRGRAAFLGLYVVFGIGSNLAQLAYAGASFGGMSGVLYGLFGYTWIRGKINPASGLFVDHQNVVIMLAWFFACLTGWLGPVANMAHAGGLALGMGWGAFSGWRANRHPV